MKIRLLIGLLLCFGLAACDNVLDVDPETALPSDEAIQDADDLEAALRGGYSALQGTATATLYSQELIIIPDLFADNLDHTGTFTTFGEMDTRNVFPDNVSLYGLWSQSYVGIDQANNVLAAIPNLGDVAQETLDQFQGEALFLRALNHFNLVLLFGDVPLMLEPTTAADAIDAPARTSQSEVYAQIEADLQQAEQLLAPSNAPGRATSGAAAALLARAYLYQGEWQAAADKATQVIESGQYELIEDYAAIFSRQNSAESILEIQYSINNNNSQAFWFFPDDLGGRLEYAPSGDLVAAYEAGDERFDASIGVYDGTPYVQKYFRIANGDDNVLVLRLAEMYLIRAEANLNLGASAETIQADINTVRRRAGLDDAAAATTAELRQAIAHERRLEFAFEGHRLFDLRRMGLGEEELNVAAERLIFPIPQAELDVNANLTQNPGY